MSNTPAWLAEKRRLHILMILQKTGGKQNESVLRAGLENLGHYAELTWEEIRADLSFMAQRQLLHLERYTLNDLPTDIDRELIAAEMFDGEMVIAQITKRGVEAAEGRTTVPGVRRPTIGV